jgi:hypothetical protein
MAGVPQTQADTARARRAAEVLLLGLGALGFVLLSRYHGRHRCDDAFIYFRYADNIVAGLGPVWNRGEAVEGYSSPLWLGFLVLGRALGIGLPGWATAWGIAFSALCLLFVHRLALASSGSRLAAAAAVAGCSLLYPLYYWAPAGLETALYAALVTAAAWALAGPPARWWAVVAALLGVARPEGPALVIGFLGLVWLAHGRAALRPAAVAVALLPALAWLLFRRATYGDLLPNTYYAKATGALAVRVTAGAIYALTGILALAATAVGLRLAGVATRRHLAVVSLAGLLLAVVLWGGGDWMWHGRLVLPALPGLLALMLAAIAAVPGSRRLVPVLVCTLGFVSFLPRPGLLAELVAARRLPETAYQEGTLVPASQQVARFIADHYPADALVAVNHAGALPHALPNPVLDMTGLLDRHIAHAAAGGLHGKHDAAYVLARRPRLIVLNSRVPPGTAGIWYHPGYWSGETALVAHPELVARYRPVPRTWAWRWQAQGGYILLYERVPK